VTPSEANLPLDNCTLSRRYGVRQGNLGYDGSSRTGTVGAWGVGMDVQVSVLRQLLRAAYMAKQAAEAETAERRIHDAIDTFLDAIVVETAMADRARAFELARDALEHFDDYYQEIGDEQQPGTRRHDRTPREDLAQQYHAELDGPADGALRLRIGPLRPADPLVVIDLVEHAPHDARQLATALGFGDAGWAPL
jgi:hypothetical protein